MAWQKTMRIQEVDDQGNTIAEIDKVAAHENGGVWHRAISVFLFNSEGRLLIQQRAKSKYHFAGLWANSCCSHPGAFETPVEAAERAMMVELGVAALVREVGVVRYEAFDSLSGMTEREHDHVLVGRFDGLVSPNQDEVSETRWIEIAALRQEISRNPAEFAPWLKVILDSGMIDDHLSK